VSKEKQIQDLIKIIGDLKSKDEIINNLTIHKECKPESSHEKLQRELDEMKAKFEAQKREHETALN
jgi:hypothetical protein